MQPYIFGLFQPLPSIGDDMPLPVVIGLPWLLAALASLLATALAFFAELITRRLIIIASVVLALGALTLGFFAGILVILSGLSDIAPPSMSIALGLIYPENFPLIVSVLFTARIARWAYEWNVKILQFRL
jgi:hypothetical protein